MALTVSSIVELIVTVTSILVTITVRTRLALQNQAISYRALSSKLRFHDVSREGLKFAGMVAFFFLQPDYVRTLLLALKPPTCENPPFNICKKTDLVNHDSLVRNRPTIIPNEDDALFLPLPYLVLR
jgi:hypothetical protein